MSVDWSVVVRARNEQGLIEGTLASLEEQKGLDGRDVEVVVVNNGSTDRTGELARAWARRTVGRFAAVRVIDEPLVGRLAALRRGSKEASGRWIASLDGDSIADRSWLASVLAHVTRHAWEVGGSGKLRFRDGSSFSRVLYALYRDAWFGFFGWCGVGWLSGANFWMQAEALRDALAGGRLVDDRFDDKRIAIECRRRVLQGDESYRVGYCPRAVVYTENWMIDVDRSRVFEATWLASYLDEIRYVGLVGEACKAVACGLVKELAIHGRARRKVGSRAGNVA